MSVRLPILVLGGSDPGPDAVPQGMPPGQMLSGFKAAQPLPWGRCLAAEVIERLRQSGRFHDPLLVGPRRIYEGLVDVTIADVEGNLAATLQRAVEAVAEHFCTSAPVAFITSDILPTAEEICRLLDESYLPHQDAVFWGQFIAAEPETMGAGDWKPSYHFRPDRERPPQNFYPGHLVIARPDALRLPLAVYLLSLAYRYRNRELRRRYLRMVARSLWRFFQEDLQNLVRGQLPGLTVSIPYHALTAFFKYRRGTAAVADFERAVARGFLHRRHVHDARDRPVVFSVTPITSFAKDIDTIAEFTEAAERGR